MAESETSSSILLVWLAPEQQFEKVVLWPTPNVYCWPRDMIAGMGKQFHAWGVPGLWSLKKQPTAE